MADIERNRAWGATTPLGQGRTTEDRLPRPAVCVGSLANSGTSIDVRSSGGDGHKKAKSPLEWTPRQRAAFLAREQEALEIVQLGDRTNTRASQPISMPSDDDLPPPGWREQWGRRDDDTTVLTSHHHQLHEKANAAD